MVRRGLNDMKSTISVVTHMVTFGPFLEWVRNKVLELACD